MMSCPFFFISSVHYIYIISSQLRKRKLQWQGFMRVPQDITPLSNSVYNHIQFSDQYFFSFENKLPSFQSLQRNASNDGRHYLTTPISSSSALWLNRCWGDLSVVTDYHLSKPLVKNNRIFNHFVAKCSSPCWVDI